MNKFSPKNNRGFTVIEAMVSISILLLAISGAFAVAQSSLQSSSMVKNRVTAYYLAQDALEYIRHLRDNNGLFMLKNKTNPTSPISWLDGFAAPDTNLSDPADNSDPCYFGKTCILDSSGNLIKIGADNNTEYSNPYTCLNEQGASSDLYCPPLYLNGNTGRFQYYSDESTTQTSFIRAVEVLPVFGNGNAVQVRVRVSWDQPSTGGRASLEVSDFLFNWQQLAPF